MESTRLHIVAALAAALFVAGCESVEEKAERLYAEAVALAGEGETEKAIVSLKSVFNLNGAHRDARMLYADLKRDGRDVTEAYRHYLLVAEQYPRDFEARRNLAELAQLVGNWEEVERHATAALEIEPEDTRIRAVAAALDYREARRAEDAEAVEQAVADAQDIVAELPSNRIARQVVVDDLIQNGRYGEAIESLDRAIALEPDNAEFHQLKLALLGQLDDMAGVGAQLRTMVELFPENVEVRSALVRWYLAEGDADGAETFVRDLVAQQGDEIPPRVALIQFLTQVRGYEAALDQLERFIDEGLDDVTFRTMQAGLIYDNVDRQRGITVMEDMLADREPSSETRTVQTTLARMLIGVGETDRARGLVETVLEQDPEQVEALKLKANWLIDEDQTRDAILALRTVLDQTPEDVEAITLLARAYERDGNRELMAESLALAVEASGNAAEPSVRYASYLMQNDKFLSAEDILLAALRTAPAEVEILRALGQVYSELADWPRVEQVIEALERLGTPEATSVATGLEASMLQRLQRTEESIALLERFMADGEQSLGAQAAIVRTHLSNGDIQPARAYLDGLLAEAETEGPSERRDGILYLDAALRAVEGDFDQAISIYQDLVERNEAAEPVWRAYIATLLRQGKDEEAAEVLETALSSVPDDRNLLWLKAGLLERDGNVDGAIAIYEELYDRDSNSTIVANNLASLITTYRDDEESLQRAYRIARRLRGIEVPALQDTYGWIAYRLGNYSEAVEHLEPAAAGLPDDPLVQYHLAKTYIALGRGAEAGPLLERSVAMWEGEESSHLADAEAELRRLSSETAADPVADGGN